jgi:hypothetical protein
VALWEIGQRKTLNVDPRIDSEVRES